MWSKWPNIKAMYLSNVAVYIHQRLCPHTSELFERTLNINQSINQSINQTRLYTALLLHYLSIARSLILYDIVVYFVCLFVWRFSSYSRLFHSYGDVTIIGKGLQILAYVRHSWP